MTHIRCREERVVKPINDVEDHIKAGVDQHADCINTPDEFTVEHLRPDSLKVEKEAVLEEGKHDKKSGVEGVAEEIVKTVNNIRSVLKHDAHVEHEGDQESHQELDPIVGVRHGIL